MAEGEFEAREKYPDSWRLDHPNFGDVYQTTYVKGIIREFEKISDDPLKVKSRVKVEIEGQGVSEFIPLCYHPKEGYWDNEKEGIQATDFNQEGNYFERAWMSFRAGDEVKVMLREKEPYAVVGFMDGVPRIGEDILQLKGIHGNGDLDDMVHPFSRQLQLSKAIIKVDEWGNPDCAYSNWNEEKKGPDGLELGLNKVIDKPLAIRPVLNSPLLLKRVYFWFFNIGPFAVLFYVNGSTFYGEPWPGPPLGIYGGSTTSTGNFYVKVYEEGMENEVAAFLNGQIFGGDEDPKLKSIGFKRAKMNPDFNPPEAFHGLSPFFIPESLKIYTRPHTKEELQEAGMWPRN